VGEALGLAPIAQATTIARTLVANDAPVAAMFDVVHPKVSLPEDDDLRARLAGGQMVLDVLIAIGVPVTFARTRAIPSLLSPRDRAGKLLGVKRTTAVLELEELYYAGREERVAYSRDLFAPGGLDVTVMRSFESTRPTPIANVRGVRASAGRRRSRDDGA
jgi:GntR family transcriptional regulator